MPQQITCAELLELSKEHQGATLLDVRTQTEWDQDGKPNGQELGLNTSFLSYLIDTDNGRVVNDKFDETLEGFKIDKNKVVFVMCKSGMRSSKVAQILDQRGYKTYNVVNGFICSEDV